MNTFNLIVTITVPVIFIAYIVWDLVSHKYTAKTTEMSYAPEIHKINWENMRNTGERLPEDEISSRTQNDVVTYKELFL